MKLTLEQKNYLKSIKSKKRRKSQKLDFKAKNFIFGLDDTEDFNSLTDKINDIKVNYHLVKEDVNIGAQSLLIFQALNENDQLKEIAEKKYTKEDLHKAFEDYFKTI